MKVLGEYPMMQQRGLNRRDPIPANSRMFQELYIQTQRCPCGGQMRLVAGGLSQELDVQSGLCTACSARRRYFFTGSATPSSLSASKAFFAFEAALDAGLNAVDMEEWEVAERHFEEAVSLELWFGPAHLQLGLIALSRQDWEAARCALEKAAGLIPLEPGLHDALCRLWTALGNDEKAARHGWLSLQLDSSLDDADTRR